MVRIGFSSLKLNEIESYKSSYNKFKGRHTTAVIVASWYHWSSRFLPFSYPALLACGFCFFFFSLSQDGYSIFRICIHISGRKIKSKWQNPAANWICSFSSLKHWLSWILIWDAFVYISMDRNGPIGYSYFLDSLRMWLFQQGTLLHRLKLWVFYKGIKERLVMEQTSISQPHIQKLGKCRHYVEFLALCMPASLKKL